MSTITGRVAAGAAFLDEHDPEWWRADAERAIDLDRLNLNYGDSCILGQRCPMETLRFHLGYEPDEEDDDYEFKYVAYAGEISGLPTTGVRDALEAWAVSHGFNKPFGNDKAEYTDLTAEWRRVIEMRRSA